MCVGGRGRAYLELSSSSFQGRGRAGEILSRGTMKTNPTPPNGPLHSNHSPVCTCVSCAGESTNGFRSRCGGMFGDEQQTKRQDAHRKISLGQSGSDEGKSGSDEGEVHDKEVGVSGGLRPPDLCIDSSPGKNLDTPTNATSSFGATPTSGNPAESPSDDPIVAREGELLSPEIKVVTPREDPKKVMQRCMSDQSVGLQPPPSECM